jgi:hypothetical protein
MYYRISISGKIVLVFMLIITTVVWNKASAEFLCSSNQSQQSKSNLFNTYSTHYVLTQNVPENRKKSLMQRKIKTSKPVNPDWADWAWGIGTIYKYGYFSGNIATIFSNYQIYKPLYINLRLKKFYFDLGISGFGQMGEIKQATMVGKIYPGEFYGQFFEVFAMAGYSVYRNRRVSIVPTLAISSLNYIVYPQKRKMFDKKDAANFVYDEVKESCSSITGWGPGVFMDFRLLSFYIDNEASDISLRTRYNAFLFTKDKLYEQKGIMHEFSIGMIFSIGSHF